MPIHSAAPCRGPVVRLAGAMTLCAVVHLTLVGCASSDPRPSIGDAADLAAAASPELPSRRPDWSSPWNAEPSWDGRSPLSAESAVAIALTRNRALRMAVTEIAVAQAKLAEARTPPNPTASFAYGFPTDGGPGSMITASVMAQLSWLWGSERRIAAADARLRERILLAADRALATVATVREQHLAIVGAEETLRWVEDAERAAAARRDLVAAQADAGVGTATERRAAESAWRMAHQEALEAAMELHHAKLALLGTLGMTEHEAATDLAWTSDGAWPEPPPFADEVGADRWARRAATRRLDVAARAAALRAADADARLAGLEGLPEIELGAMFERSMDGGDVAGPAIDFTVPLPARAQAAAAEANAMREAAALSLAEAIEGAVAEARTDAMEWSATMTAWRDGSEARRIIAERDLALADEARAAGAESSLAALDARAMLAERTVAALRDRGKALAAAIRLERSMGGLPRADETAATTAPAPVSRADGGAIDATPRVQASAAGAEGSRR